MGGKRDLRRCVSLMDDTNASQPLLARDQIPPNHVTDFCPIIIRIDECSDNEDESDRNRNTNDHVRSSTNHISPSYRTHAPSAYNHSSPRSSTYNSPRCSPTFLEVPENSELSLLKATAVRLNLRTRTSSFMEWQANWLDNSRAPPQFPLLVEEGNSTREGADRLTEERKERINQALEWLKTELKEMQSHDQHLARQLLSLRHDIHQLRLRRSCQEHRDLLDDVQSELEEQVELSDVLDLPIDLSLNDTPLKQLGVTRMNISTRRFSMC